MTTLPTIKDTQFIRFLAFHVSKSYTIAQMSARSFAVVSVLSAPRRDVDDVDLHILMAFRGRSKKTNRGGIPIHGARRINHEPL